MDALRDQRRWPWLGDLTRDLGESARTLLRVPAFTGVAVFTLAVGLGAATAVFSVLNAVVLQPLAYPQPDRLVGVWMTAPGAPGVADVSGALRLSASMYFTFADENRAFDRVGIWVPNAVTITGAGDPEELHAVVVSDGVLEALDVPPVVGRWLDAADQTPKAAGGVVLGYGYWQRQFGGARDVIGRRLRVDEVSREIVGVMPPGFTVLGETPEIILPAAFDRSRVKLAGFGLLGLARLKPGVTIADANADVARMLPIWQSRWPAAASVDPKVYDSWRIAPAIRPLKSDVVGHAANVLWILMGTVGLLLAMAVANVANLVLVRADGRQRELAVRAAIGAGRGRILRGLIVEQVVLAMVGGAGGLALASGAIRALVAINPPHLPRLGELGVDVRTTAFALGGALLASVFFSVIPAIRSGGSPLASAMRGSSRAATETRDRRRLRDLLVVTQVGLAFVLLVCSGLLLRTFKALAAVDPGFSDAAHVQTLRVSIPQKLEPDPVKVMNWQRQILEKMNAIGGVTSAGFASALPLDGEAPDWDDIMPEGRIYRPGEVPSFRVFKFISPGFFRATGTPVIAGREYAWTDLTERRRVAIVSARLARELWGSTSGAIGKRVRTLDAAPWREVIGVVQDTRDNGVDQAPPATVYWPSYGEGLYDAGGSSIANTVTFTIRSDRAGTPALVDDLRRAVWSVSRSLPVASVRTLDDIYVQSMAATSFTMTLLTVAGGIGLLLGIVGIYGLVSYGVAQRTREIGIRLALGASEGTVKVIFMQRALVLTAAGLALGLAASVALTRVMAALLFETSPLDPVTYVAVPIVLVLAAGLASYVPARRAAAVDPVEALRAE